MAWVVVGVVSPVIVIHLSFASRTHFRLPAHMTPPFISSSLTSLLLHSAVTTCGSETRHILSDLSQSHKYLFIIFSPSFFLDV